MGNDDLIASFKKCPAKRLGNRLIDSVVPLGKNNFLRLSGMKEFLDHLAGIFKSLRWPVRLNNVPPDAHWKSRDIISH